MVKIVAPADLYVPALADDPETGGVVEEGQEVELPAAAAHSLLDQGWTKSGAKKAKNSSTPPVSPASTPEK